MFVYILLLNVGFEREVFSALSCNWYSYFFFLFADKTLIKSSNSFLLMVLLAQYIYMHFKYLSTCLLVALV